MDVGFGDQLAHHFDGDRAVCGQQRQRHQQRGQELAGDIATYLDGGITELAEIGLADVQRRKALIFQVINLAAQLAQRIDQVANRALVHTGNARHLKTAPQHRQGRRQWAHGSTGVA